jgi:hypothetical protein
MMESVSATSEWSDPGLVIASDSPPRNAEPAIVTFSAMIDHFGDEIYRFACQLTRNSSDADDLYQETLLKAFRAFGRLSVDANHRAWMYRIASNTFISDRRKIGRVNPMSDEVEMTLRAPASNVVESLDARDTLRDVEHAVASRRSNAPPSSCGNTTGSIIPRSLPRSSARKWRPVQMSTRRSASCEHSFHTGWRRSP